MAQKKEIVQFFLEDGTSFLIETDAKSNSSFERASVGGVEDVIKAEHTFEKSLDRVIPFASAALNRLRYKLLTPADEIELKFGVKMTAEAGAIIASVSSEVNFEVTLRWKQPELNTK